MESTLNLACQATGTKEGARAAYRQAQVGIRHDSSIPDDRNNIHQSNVTILSHRPCSYQHR